MSTRNSETLQQLILVQQSFKGLLEQTYARASDEIKDKIKEEKFDILTINNETIIPTVWEFVIKNHLPLQESKGSTWHTIKISFWHDSAPDSRFAGSGGPYDIQKAESATVGDTKSSNTIVIRERPRVAANGKADLNLLQNQRLHIAQMMTMSLRYSKAERAEHPVDLLRQYAIE